MQMPGRKFTQANSSYRYGFNGKEKDPNIVSEDYDYGARIYDTRLVRWLSADPLQNKYADLSPYNYCANSPICAKDPDGRLIIFINGLWTPGTGIDAPFEPYWGRAWVKQAQNRIGDHSQPIFFDGSMGGATALAEDGKLHPYYASDRKAWGEMQGLNSASSIIKNLKEGETIKIITNSMGTAFARGLTQGILEYQEYENKKITAFNDGLNQQIADLQTDNMLLSSNIKTKQSGIPLTTLYTKVEQKVLAQIKVNNKKIAKLETSKQKLLNVQFEFEVDLSSHQIDYANPDVNNNYYMMTNNFSDLEKIFVDQKSIKGAKNLGNMSTHHSSGADPDKLPASSTPDPNPK